MKTRAKAGLTVLALASAVAFAGPALAQDSGFYIGGALGQSEIKGACSGLPPGVSCDEEDTGWKIFGGFQFNRHLGVELGYANLGEASASGLGVTATAEVTAWDLVAVGSLPIMDRFSVYGKLGLFLADAEVTSNVGVSSDESESGITFGVGLRYDFTRNLGLRAEWQRYQEVDDETDVNLLSIGIVWKF
jgi:OOP family OmpA-OmpF porin